MFLRKLHAGVALSFVLWMNPIAAADAVTNSTYYCNICGCDGCDYAFPTGVVTFVYQNQTLKNNCNHWNRTAQNPNAIDPDFCLNELPKFIRGPCQCYDRGGAPLPSLLSPAPTPAVTPLRDLNPSPSSPTPGTNGSNHHTNTSRATSLSQAWSTYLLMGSLTMTALWVSAAML